MPSCELVGTKSAIPMHFIADDGMTYVSAVYSQLVCTAGYRLQLEIGRYTKPLENPEPRLCGLPTFHYSPSRQSIGIAADGPVYRTGILLNCSVHQRQIALFDKPLSKMARQHRKRARGLGYHHQS